MCKRVTGSDIKNVERGIVKCVLGPYAKRNEYAGNSVMINLKTE